jgi:acetoin utilization protein AcuC
LTLSTRRAGTDEVALVYHDDLKQYDFGPSHPLRPERIELGLDLLLEAVLWEPERETLAAVEAPDSVLLSVHAPEYIEAVRNIDGSSLRSQPRFGLAPGDNPPFPHMHYAASLVAGGASEAVSAVMNGSHRHVFHPAGGLHHAHRARASGFCIYNDPAIAAAVAARQFGARVAYLDFDCHHGDGVQWLFYDDPSVLTVSFHESGEYLFPGTGGVEERGEGAGLGYAVNVPFLPYTQDGSWLAAMTRIVPPLLERFSPDLLLTVHGCDTHLWDPLTHLALTTDALRTQAAMAHDVAHRFAEGRWIAFGSGGYDWRRVVPRSWSTLWAEMSDRTLPVDIPQPWIARWKDTGQDALPETFVDEFVAYPTDTSGEIAARNARTLEAVLRGLTA